MAWLAPHRLNRHCHSFPLIPAAAIFRRNLYIRKEAISSEPKPTNMAHPQKTVQELSLRDPQGFWLHHADQLHWHKRPSCAVTKRSKALPSGTSHDHWSWFPDGEISTTYNCVDRHVQNGCGDNVAIIWDSPATGAKEKYTYSQLLDEVEVLAGVLKEEGVRKGDVVIIYSMAILDPLSSRVYTDIYP